MLENGIYLFGLTLVERVPFLVEIGVLLDVFVAVFIMGIVVFHINREFDSISAENLVELNELSRSARHVAPSRADPVGWRSAVGVRAPAGWRTTGARRCGERRSPCDRRCPVAGPRADALNGWLAVDSLGLIVLTLVSVLFAAVVTYAVGVLRQESPRGGRWFAGCLLGFLTATSLVCVSQNLALMWVGMETTTLTIAPLIFTVTIADRSRRCGSTWSCRRSASRSRSWGCFSSPRPIRRPDGPAARVG